MTDQCNWTKVEGYAPDMDSAGVVAKAGDKRVVIFDTGKGLRGMELACPHLKAPMSKGVLMGAGTMVRCPKHNFIFRLNDGKGVNCVGLNLKVYDVRQVDDTLEVLL